MADDIIIVGGGISGLLTGAILAKKGHSIMLFEKVSKLGGRSNSIEKEGYIVDFGLHVIRYSTKSAMAKIFKKYLGEKLDMFNLGDIKLFKDGAFHDFPLSMRGLASTDLFNEEEKKGFGEVLVDILKTNTEKYLDVPVPDYIKELQEKYGEFSDPVRDFLVNVANLMCISTKTELLSTGEFVDGIKLGAKAPSGTAYPIGGFKKIIDRLTAIIKENGTIRLNTKVDSVKIEGGQVKGISIGSEFIEADTVILNIPTKDIFNLIPESNFSPDFVKMAKNIIPTAGLSIDFGLKQKIFDHQGSILTTEPFTYSIFTSNMDPSVAPEGEQLYTIFQIVELNELKDAEKVKQVKAGMTKLLNEMFPNFSNNIKWERMYAGIFDGAAPYVTQHRNKRPSIKSTIKGLYFTGDSYGVQGTGGEIAHTSALECATAILEEKEAGLTASPQTKPA